MLLSIWEKNGGKEVNERLDWVSSFQKGFSDHGLLVVVGKENTLLLSVSHLSGFVRATYLTQILLEKNFANCL